MPMDSRMAWMRHDMSGMMNRPAPRDTNQAWPRMMSFHHQGLIAIADTAGPKLGATAKEDARKRAAKRRDEQQRTMGMLGSQYTGTLMPMIMPSNRTMLDSVRSASGGDADGVFHRQVIAHHREGIQMTDLMLPHLTGQVKRMAEKSRGEQQKEIAELEKKAGGSR